MVKTTLVFSVLLIALGLVGYYGTGSIHSTALIPAWIGIALGFGGLLAISPSESRRKLFMHINVTIGVIGFLGGFVEALRGYLHAQAVGLAPDRIALTDKLAMAVLMLFYVLLCVRSFIAVRRAGKV
jgi:hypothetical protein